MGEWFSKLFGGFAFWQGKFWGKIIYFFVLFMAFNFVMNTLFPKLKRETRVERIDTYIEAPDNQKVAFGGIKLWRFGIGIFYE